MRAMQSSSMSRRGFCLCCLGSAGLAATGGRLSPREAFAEARGLVSLIKDSAAASPIVIHKLRNNISVLEGSGGNVAVLTGPDGKVLIDAGISVSRPQMTKALAELGADPVTHLINTHWHFDHADGNAWLNSIGAKIIAQENTLKYLSQVQRVEDWDYNFLALPPNGLPTEVFASEHALKLNGASIALKHYGPAHTDGDISVTFGEADVVHVGGYVLERGLSVHRLFDRRQHRRHDCGVRRQSRRDHRQDDRHSRTRKAGEQQGRASGIPRHACGRPRECRDAQKEGHDAGRNGCGQADRRLRREVRQLRHRPRLLHPARLRGRMIRRADAPVEQALAHDRESLSAPAGLRARRWPSSRPASPCSTISRLACSDRRWGSRVCRWLGASLISGMARRSGSRPPSPFSR